MRASKTTKSVETVTLEMTMNQAKLLYALASTVGMPKARFINLCAELKVDPNNLITACTSNVVDSLGHVIG